MTSDEFNSEDMELFLELIEISGLHSSRQFEAALLRSKQLLDKTSNIKPPEEKRELFLTAVASTAALAFDSAMKLGDYKTSLTFAEKEVQAGLDIGGINYSLVRSLNNRGLAHLELGNLVRAENDFQQALQFAEQLSDERMGDLKTIIRSNLGNLQVGRKEDDHANRNLLISGLETKSMFMNLATGGNWWNHLNNLATVASNAGNYDQAISYYQEILNRDTNNELGHLEKGIIYCNWGMVLSNMGKKDEAILYLEKACEAHRQVPGTQVALATDLYNLGLIYISQEQLENAIRSLKEAWDIIRTTSHRSILVLQILRWLAFGRMLQKDHDRAQAILLKGLEIYESFRPDIATSEEGQEGIYDVYRALIGYLLYMVVHDGFSDQAMGYVERAKARYWLEKTVQQKQDLGKHVSRESAIGRQNTDSGLRNIQFVDNANEVKELSGRDTLILNFFLGKEALFICYAFNRMFGATRIDLSEKQLLEMIQEFRNDLMSSSRRAGNSPVGKELSNLLFGRILDTEWKLRFINIMPDGVLWYLPFEALPLPDILRTKMNIQYFGDIAPVGYMPTSTVLKVLYEREARVNNLKMWKLLVVTNPNASEGFAALPGVVSETELLKNSVRAVASTEVLYGPDASPENLLSKIPNCSHVHISTHAFAEFDLSEPYIRLYGTNQSDGKLYSSQVSETIMQADLVFLSACSTALGKKSEGEGLMSLGRAFLLGGARCVVASLWPIRDEEAPRFVSLFYQHLIEQKSIARALQRARIDFRQSGGSPRTWAAFQALGDADRRVERHRVLDIH
jgi:CHAT domain-containing protein/tetratricopeptide (TPR) repeat protein